MPFLQLKNISLAFAERDVLDQVNFTLQAGQKAALSGANGSGKSTLLKILAGVTEPDSGQVICPEGTRFAYLPQSGILLGTGTVYQEAEVAFAPWRDHEAQMHALAESLAQLEGAAAEKALIKHHEMQEALLDSGYYSRRETVERTLKGLGFTQEQLDRPASEFSGGWQMRVALARCLLEKPDLLLLDEPTNYLDIEAKDWLERFLKNFSGGFFLVSHDRGFLDAVVAEVVEIFRGSLTSYKGNYSTYEERRRLEIQQLEEAYKVQQAEIEKAEEYINRFRAQATKAAGVQSRIKALAKVERIELPESLSRMHFSFPPAPHCGKQVLDLQNLSKSYGSHQVIHNLEIMILKGEKIAVAGRNGAGKSTLMRILAGADRDFQGTLRYGTDVKAAYFSQDHEKNLDPALSVLEEAEKDAPTALVPRLRDLLGAFLFRGDDVFKKTAVLSGGEKNRLSLVKLLLEPANLLLLDEPTNHLDLASKDVLLDALLEFQGTVLVVSHDKYFLSKLAQKVLELSPQGHRVHLGGWQNYMEKLERENAEVFGGAVSASGTSGAPAEDKKTSSQVSREEAKRRQAALRKLEREETALMDELAQVEAEQSQLNDDLTKSEVYTDGAKVKAIQSRQAELETRSAQIQTRWEAIVLEQEELGKE